MQNFVAEGLPNFTGKRLDNYQLLDQIGAGGMGVVYRAYDTRLKRDVAIKFMLNATDAGHNKDRFLREMEITARLDHPNIVKVYYVGAWETHPYFAMQYVQGLPLHKYIEQRQPGLSEKLQIVEKIAAALDYAHRQKVVHRDIKPSNIMVGDDGEPVLMDFGLAKVSRLDDYSLTRTGEVVGTPEYMAPEQATGNKREVDAQTDVYGLGAALYHALTGVPPFAGESLLAKVRQVVEKPVRPPRRLCPEIPAAVEKVCLKALEKKKRHRYESARAMAADMHRFRHGKLPQAVAFYRRRILIRVVGVLGMILLLAGAIGLLWRWQPAYKTNLHMRDYGKELEKYYLSACQKLQQAPQEAYLYLRQVSQLCRQLEANNGTADPVYRKLAPRIPYDMLEAAHNGGDYAVAYELANQLLLKRGQAAGMRLLWQVASAAYHCGRSEEAEQHLQALLQSLANASPAQQAEVTFYAAGARYYQGLLAYKHGKLAAAQEHFAQAMRLLPRTGAEFSASLYLHYCATLLVDIDVYPGAERMREIGDCLALVEQSKNSRLPGSLYEETKARYLLQQANLEAEPTRQQTVMQVLRLLEQCWQVKPADANWYYIRAKAYLLLGQTEQAEQDLNTTSDLDPCQLGAVVTKADLLWSAPNVGALKRYAIDLPAYVYKGGVSSMAMFADEFAHLQERPPLSDCGIPFTAALFAEYCHRLSDVSPEVREIAATAITSMVPYSETMAALANADTHVPAAELARLRQQIEHKAWQQRWAKFVALLTRIPSHGKMVELSLFYPRDVDLLQQLVASQEDLFLRFLAARVLAHLPALAVREQLVDTYLANDRDDDALANKILVARVLQETGYEHALVESGWMSHIWRVLSQNPDRVFPSANTAARDFLAALLAEIVLPQDADGLSILNWLLANTSERTRLVAASRFTWPQNMSADDVNAPLIKALRQGIFSKRAEIRAFALSFLGRATTTSNMESNWQWQQIIDKHFISADIIEFLGRDLASALPSVQSSTLYFWRETSGLLVDTKKPLANLLCQVVRPLWNHRDPLLRSQAISTSTSLGDTDVFDKIVMSDSASLIEKMAVFIGFTSGNNQAAKQTATAMFPKMLNQGMMDNNNTRVRASLIYLVGFVDQIAMLFLPRLVKCLDDADFCMRTAALVSLGYRAKLQAKTVDKIRHIARHDPSPYVRWMAVAVMLHYSYREKLPEHAEWYELARQQQTTDKYHTIAAGGYTIAWQRDICPHYSTHSRFRWPREQSWDHMLHQFMKHTQKMQRYQEHRGRLENILGLLGEQASDPGYQIYTMFLGLLCEKEGDWERAGRLFGDMMQRLGNSDQYFTIAWSQCMIRQGKAAEADKILRQKLRECADKAAANLDKEQISLTYHSQLLRALAAVATATGGDRRQREEWLWRQYWMAPQQARALQAVGEHAWLSGDYHKALYIFQELQNRLPQNSEFSIWLARTHARRNDAEKVAVALRIAYYQMEQLLTLQELQAYAELRPFLQRADVQEIWKQKK